MEMNQLELSFAKFWLARLKSKSPKEYQLITNAAKLIVAICGLYILAFNTCNLATYGAIYGTINAICIGLGAGATALGFTSATTTTDPSLMLQEVATNVNAVKGDIVSLQAVPEVKKN